MTEDQRRPDPKAGGYDVIIVGASIAGSTAAIQYGRQGLKVALLERSPNPRHFKRACTHTIAAGAVPILEDLGLSEGLRAASAPMHKWELYTRYGWIRGDLDGYGYPKWNCTVRRETLDPLMRAQAARTPGVELLAGWTVERLLRRGERVIGVTARNRTSEQIELYARLIVGADGRSSRVAAEAGMREHRRRHERLAVWGYFKDVELRSAPDSQIYFLDPDCAYLMATDSGLSVLVIAVHKRHLPEYRADPKGFYRRFVRRLPDAPAFDDADQVGPLVSRLDMTNIRRPAGAKGVALIGDAACAVDPVWGWGCGWALLSATLLTEATTPALRARRGLDRAVLRYRWRHFLRFAGPYQLAADYSRGRTFNMFERALFTAAAEDQVVARHLHSYVTSSIGVGRLIASRPALRALRVALRAAARPRPPTQTWLGPAPAPTVPEVPDERSRYHQPQT
jgi:flavin-dependent dehydrogenase